LSREFRTGLLRVKVFVTRDSLGREAARAGAEFIREAIRRQGKARLLFSAANSQLEMIGSLAEEKDIDWNCVQVFHVDEYVGLPLSHPESFSGWVERNLVNVVRPGKANYIRGDAEEAEKECRRYATLLTEDKINVSFLGIGENGHIGFNDPLAADFADPEVVKLITLDERCREQQVREGHWPELSVVPGVGFAVTCPTLISAEHIICCVPGTPKAEAVKAALEGPIATSCPASCMRKHSDAILYLDIQSAALLSEGNS
jgi:glucosamine-6-phosphate deaminase